MTELARLRRCARILRRAQPHTPFIVDARYRTITQRGSFAGLPCDFTESLEAWEAYVATLAEAVPS